MTIHWLNRHGDGALTPVYTAQNISTAFWPFLVNATSWKENYHTLCEWIIEFLPRPVVYEVYASTLQRWGYDSDITSSSGLRSSASRERAAMHFSVKPVGGHGCVMARFHRGSCSTSWFSSAHRVNNGNWVDIEQLMLLLQMLKSR